MTKVESITNEIKKIMSVKITDTIQYNMWIKDIKPISLVDNTLYIEVKSRMIVNMINRFYITMLKESLDMIIDPKNNSSKIVVTSPDMDDYEEILMKGREVNEDGQQQFTIKKRNSNLNLKASYTFDNFIKGKSNELALAASENVAEHAISPTKVKAYNPLFIYGGSGLGKTHLMQAIAHRIIERNPDKYIMYLSSEKFTNEMISSVRENKNEEFRRKYRSVDVLLIDDIQFIANKTGTQEEFFHTFEELYNAGKQIVISSDKPPREINQLEERLKSRFGWGLIVDISRPDFETRVAILQDKLLKEKGNATDDVINYIAENIDTNIRELEGALLKVLAISNIRKKKISTMEDAVEALDSIVSHKKKVITIDYIKEVVCSKFKITIDEINGKSRKKEITVPRQIAMYLSRELTQNSLMNIADSFNRDHTTILHGHDKIEKEMQSDEQLRLLLEDLEKEIRQ